MNMNYEDFYDEVWDYVSISAVTDDMWDKHKDKFMEMTFFLYGIYNNSVMYLPGNDDGINLISLKTIARIIESFAINFSQELNT